MEEEVSNYNVLIDVDTLFDTRLPILYGLSEDTMTDYISSDKYFNRVKDEFGDIPSSVFKGYYDNRDKRVLLASQPTEMFNLLTEYIGSTILAMTSIGDARQLTVYLNVYPYELVGDEVETITTLIDDDRIILQPVYLSNEDITPKWVDENVGVIIKYDSLNWVDYHMSFGTLPKTPLMDVILMGPHMFTGDVSSKDVKQEVFNQMLESINTLIGFSFIKTSYYCIMKQ